MGQWIPVFKAGTHTDAAGVTRTYSPEVLDMIAAAYDTGVHEAPVVIGHPSDDQPAYAWVDQVKRVGEILWVHMRETAKEFTQWVRDGLFKKISVALYLPGDSPAPGKWYLKHVGFLGAMPPAVKGLPPVAMKERKGQAVLEEDKEHVPLEQALDVEEALDRFFRAFDLFRSRVVNDMLDEGVAGKKDALSKHLKEFAAVVDELKFREPKKAPGTVVRLTFAEVKELCPSCAERMAFLNLRELKLDWGRPGEFQGFNAGLCDRFAPKDGFHTRCMESSLGGKADDPGAMCNALAEWCKGHGHLAEAKPRSQSGGASAAPMPLVAQRPDWWGHGGRT